MLVLRVRRGAQVRVKDRVSGRILAIRVQPERPESPRRDSVELAFHDPDHVYEIMREEKLADHDRSGLMPATVPFREAELGTPRRGA